MHFNRAGISAAILLSTAVSAQAAVTQPNGTMVPLPVPQVEINLAAGTNPPAVVTLPALFSARGETLDWQKDALTSPSTFSPQCTFTGELVLRGGACAIDFGWYNVVPGRTGPPPESEIYVLIAGPSNLPAFHPGVGETGPMFSTASIRADPNYKGGLIGFALKGAPPDCRQTHFSEQDLNVTCTNCTPNKGWAAALIWKSTKTPNAYYIGFEDLPMSPTDFGGAPGQPYRNDGDFNDSVYFLSGVTCSGGGVSCDTTMPGVCAAGLTECVTGTTLTCRPTVKPSAESCDGLDNDCNGQIDEMAPCPAGWICDRGACVPPCSEFGCAEGFACNGQRCVDTACMGKTCAEGKVCKLGSCVGPCDGVTCPKGQACRVGRCVDPCDGVTCDPDRVCDGGICVTHCKCSSCGAGKGCDKGGLCLDTSCVDKSCPSGQACVAGSCVDACGGAVCPAGQECKSGGCVDLPKPDGGAPPVVSTGGAPGGGGGGGGAGNLGGGADAGIGGGDGGVAGLQPRKFGPDCICSAAEAPSPNAWVAFLLAGWVALRRRAARR